MYDAYLTLPIWHEGRATGGGDLRVGMVCGLRKETEVVEVVRWLGLAARVTMGRAVAGGARDGC